MEASRIQTDAVFSPAERDAVYKCIFNRRDVRGQFLPDPIPAEILARILRAAHHAPSVGFMQPWDFIVIGDAAVKRKVRDAFQTAHREAAEMFDDDRQRAYRALKLEGILEAPVGICVTCDRSRTGPVVLGRTHQPEMDLYSAVCAVQNLWLAARAENIGVGWVSIVRPDDLRNALGIPPAIQPIAYLCVGYVSSFLRKPELETAGWLPRTPWAMSCGLTSGTVGPARNLSSNTSSDHRTIKYRHGQRNGADSCERAHNSAASGETGTP